MKKTFDYLRGRTYAHAKGAVGTRAVEAWRHFRAIPSSSIRREGGDRFEAIIPGDPGHPAREHVLVLMVEFPIRRRLADPAHRRARSKDRRL